VTTLAIALGLFFAVFCGILAVAHSTQLGRITLLDWSLLALGGVYGLGWAVVVAVTQAGGNPHWEDWIYPFAALYPLHTLAALLLTVSVCFGWYAPAALLRHRPLRNFSGRDPAARPWEMAFWSMLLLAVILQWLYAMAYGGLIGSLDYSNLIRSAIFEQHNPLSFLKPFGGLAMISAYGFWGLWLSKRRGIATLSGMTLSFVFSLYILYSWLGRIGFLVFLAIFPLGVGLARRRNPLKLLVAGSTAFVAIIIMAYGISVWLNLKAADSLCEFIARELSFPFGSFFAQWSTGEHLFRGFRDIIAAPLYILPSSWWTNWVESLSQINTTVIMGSPKGEGGVTGGIPVDLLTLGLMQTHAVSIPVVGLMFGILLRLMQFCVDNIPLSGVRGVFEAYIALKIAVLGVFYAQPNLIVSENFAFMVGTVIILSMVVLKRYKVFSPRVFRQSTVRQHL
jgi:hypothetical protein